MFDRFVVVDWSANSTPKLGRDSIWVAVHDGTTTVVENLSTRAAAEALILDLVGSDQTSRTLIGVDFSLGYPSGTATALGLLGVPWKETWQLIAGMISDDDRNRNNRFEIAARLNAMTSNGPSPFWGCPPTLAGSSLTTTKPASFGWLDEWRHTESTLRSQGYRPFSCWQLLGAGAVGSQSLLGIPVVQRLLDHLGDRGHVWPFTTGLAAPELVDGAVVFAEVWPSLLTIDPTDGAVRDEAQVVATATWFADRQVAGDLAQLFAPAVAPAIRATVTAEEGWVLGVTG